MGLSVVPAKSHSFEKRNDCVSQSSRNVWGSAGSDSAMVLCECHIPDVEKTVFNLPGLDSAVTLAKAGGALIRHYYRTGLLGTAAGQRDSPSKVPLSPYWVSTFLLTFGVQLAILGNLGPIDWRTVSCVNCRFIYHPERRIIGRTFA